MSAGPTSEPEPRVLRALARAGWSVEDLRWETLSERGVACAIEDRHEDAARDWADALRIARHAFAENDPRLAASLTNHAAALARAGRAPVAKQLLEEALLVWSAAGHWVLAMRTENPARSSTFHLRLQLRHADTYARQQREGYLAVAQEGLEATRAHLEGRPVEVPGLSRWRSERPEGYTDSRKLLAAARLIAPRPLAGDDGSS